MFIHKRSDDFQHGERHPVKDLLMPSMILCIPFYKYLFS